MEALSLIPGLAKPKPVPKMKYISSLLIAAMAVSLTAAPPEGGKGKKPGGDRRGPPPQLIKQFDADGDGKLNKDEMQKARAEMEKRRAERLKQFDKDGDGKLTGDEQITALKAMMEKAPGMKKKMTERFDSDKSGDLSDAEITEAAKGFFSGPGGKGKKPGAKKGDAKKPGAKKGEGKKKKAE